VRRSYYLYRRWLPLVGLLFVVAAPSLPAVPLPPGDTVLSGTTVAARPELAGVVEEDVLIPYSFQGAGFSVSGVIQNRVVRSVDGTLDFYWRIISDASSTGDITAFRVGGFDGFALDGDFRLDGVGSVGPDTARNFGGGFVNFLFSDGVSAGQSSFFFFLDTQATAFSNTGSYDLLCAPNDCISPPFTTFAPALPPPSPPPQPPPLPPPPGSADLALSLTDTPDLLTVNGQLTYTITVRNNGPAAATGVQVVDSLPPGTTVFGPASSSQGACSGTVTVVCDLGTLAAGAQATVTINVIPTVTGNLSNAAMVAAFETDPDPANNSSTETTTVEPEDLATADLAIIAAAVADPMASGQRFTYTLTVRNGGPATATGVQLTNDLPRGIALGPVTASQVTYNCSDTDPMLCSLGILTSGAAATVAIDVIRTEVGTLPTRAAVNGEQLDPNSGNNFALTSAIDVPTPRTTCNSKRCMLRLTCNLSDLLGGTCDNQITLFVDMRARRQSNQRAARGPGRVRFAAATRNFPGNQTENVRLKLTRKGEELQSALIQQGRKKLRGEMRITNAVGGIDIIRLRVRLK